MIITCPQCATQYNLADSAVRHGAKARCAQCKTIFVLRVQTPQAQALPQVAPPVQAQVQQQAQNVSCGTPTPSQAPLHHVHHAPQVPHMQAQGLAPQAQQPQQYAQQGLPQQQAQVQRQQPIVADGLPPLSPPPQHPQTTGPVGAPSFMQGPAFTAEQVGLAQPLSGVPLAMHQDIPMGGTQATAPLPAAHCVQAPQPAPMPPSPPYVPPFQASSTGMSSPQDLAALTGQANLARRPQYTEGQTDRRTTSNAQHESEKQRNHESTAFQSFMTGFLLLVILGMLGYGAWRYMPRLGDAQLEAEANRIGHVSEQIKDISLHNVQQYTVQSNKAGLLLVLEGRVINNFRTPREMVKVEAALYDKDGNKLESTQQLCGVLLSKLQMQIWDASEIEAALDNELEAYAHNVNIASGTSVPFMVVFVDPPAAAVSYDVHVIDAQIPPSK